jgi:methyltransferase-like protein
MQQYHDFFTFRMFRRSLVSHQGRELQRTIRPERLLPLYVHTLADEELPAPTLRSAIPTALVTKDGLRIITNHPLSKAALRILAENQRMTYKVSDLITAAANRLRAEEPNVPLELTDEDVNGMLSAILRALCLSEYLITLTAGTPPYAVHLPERPSASHWARRQLESTRIVTTLRLERMPVDPMEADLLRVLDGTRTYDDLLQEWLGAVADGRIVLGNPPLSPEEAAVFLPRAIEERMRLLLRNALIVAPE